MFRLSYFVFLFVLAVNTKANHEDNDDYKDYLRMTVYYESQCPDSKNFVVEQLQPTLDLLHEYIVLELVPFGKAHNINKTSFECQHGPTECLGNVVQACTLDLLEDRVSDIEMVKYVACELIHEAAAYKDMMCVKQSKANVSLVKSCASGRKGIELQLKNERKTNLIKPEFIPTITFDSEFDQEMQDSAMENLTRTVCDCLDNSVTPCQDL